MTLAERQLFLLSGWLASNPKPRGVSVCYHVQACAASGDAEAQRVIESGVFRSPVLAEPVTPVPIMCPAVLERQRREAAHVPVVRTKRTEPARPVLQKTTHLPPWLSS